MPSGFADQRPRRSGVARGSFRKTASLAVAGLAALAGIGACAPDERQQAFEEQIMPIVFQVAKNVAVRLPMPYKLVAQLGVHATEEAAKLQSENRDATYLSIGQVINGERRVSMFRIDTTRKLRIDMDGRFVAEIEQNLITIEADPAGDSTIVITDARSNEPVLRGGRFAFDARNLHYDLDAGRFGDPSEPAFAGTVDLVEPRFAGTFDPWSGGRAALRNGALAADWTEGPPTRRGCSGLPEAAWNRTEVLEGLFSGNRWKHLEPVFCVRTSAGHYGALIHRTPAAGKTVLTFEYILWKNPGE